MYIQLYFTVFISAAAFATSENNETGPTIAAIPKVRVRGADVDVGSGKDPTGERIKRTVSASDRDVILNAFNCRRSLVGASDMNYLSWNSASEPDADAYLEKCDLDADFVSTTDTADTFGGCLTKYAPINDGHKSSADYFFDTDVFTNLVTSKYMLQISAGGYKFCRSLRQEGRIRTNVHYFVYGMTVSRSINISAPQYTVGNPCTRCEAGVKWCYSGLCRGDCSSSTRGCCPIGSDMPVECQTPDFVCQPETAKAVNPGSGSSRTEVKAGVMMLVILSALRSCIL